MIVSVCRFSLLRLPGQGMETVREVASGWYNVERERCVFMVLDWDEQNYYPYDPNLVVMYLSQRPHSTHASEYWEICTRLVEPKLQAGETVYRQLKLVATQNPELPYLVTGWRWCLPDQELIAILKAFQACSEHQRSNLYTRAPRPN
ncbi:hypothetical protein HY546_02810 [archaeon]|nr:hypothetical protein [archaeon]